MPDYQAILQFHAESLRAAENSVEELRDKLIPVEIVTVREVPERRFTLAIELGNDAMQTPYHVQAVLRNLATRLLTQGPGYPSYEGLRTWQATEGNLMDENGNTVGSWSVS